MLQELVVAVLVIAATLVSVWKLMPARRRLRTLMTLDSWSSRHPRLARFRERMLKPGIERAAGTGCAGCAGNSGLRRQPPQ